MNFQFYVEKLKNSDVFKNFMKEHPDSFPCSGFFIIDKTGQDNKQHFDFYIPFPPTLPNLPSPKAREIDNSVNDKRSFDVNNSNQLRANDSEQGKSNENGKMMSIQLEDMQLIPVETFGHVPEEISLEHDFDFENVEKMIEERMEKEKIKKKIQKILFSFQHLEGKDLLVGTVFISMLGMIKVVINLKNMEITEFERKSFFDIMKFSRKKKIA
ncbi:hypothetical protein KAT24_02770 [Candidatus Pacearchaeota archaeon]|nr:hypothetical protein [Candidatus Pacearchaeota archaeon]